LRCEYTSRWFTSALAKRYTAEHELIKFDDESGIGTVSITDYAQKSLGDVVFVELPETGTAIKQGGKKFSFFFHDAALRYLTAQSTFNRFRRCR
jgi:Glycine cleavage H-protein